MLGLLCLLGLITYLDRVCISVAGPRMQAALHIGASGWGWVVGMFALSYAAFEIPAGMLGDRIGPRRVLTRIVLWWSAFTTLTGLVTGFYPLLLTRFLFGAGEAGGYPNSSIAVARWFPVSERGRAFGFVLMAGQVGGALAPLLVVPIQARYGWRASFYLFGILGLVWSAVWYGWFRDAPVEKRGVSEAELAETRGLPAKAKHALPWGIALRSANLWALMCLTGCYVYTFYFFQSWFHTYLVKAQAYREEDLLLSAIPFVVGALANFGGGLASTAMVRRFGLARGRRAIGVMGLGTSGVCALAVIFIQHGLLSLVLLSLVYGGITFQQPTVFAVCLDIGGEYAGAVVGAMNTMGQVGSFVSSLAFGYLVRFYGNYTAPFWPMAALLLLGTWLWMRFDASEMLVPAERLDGRVSVPG